jgi:hypothetical protein
MELVHFPSRGLLQLKNVDFGMGNVLAYTEEPPPVPERTATCLKIVNFMILKKRRLGNQSHFLNSIGFRKSLALNHFSFQSLKQYIPFDNRKALTKPPKPLLIIM